MSVRTKDIGSSARAFVAGALTGLAGPALVAEAQFGASRPSFRRRRAGLLTGSGGREIDDKDIQRLKRYVSQRGELVPSRITSLSPKAQRELLLTIMRARLPGVLPP